MLLKEQVNAFLHHAFLSIISSNITDRSPKMAPLRFSAILYTILLTHIAPTTAAQISKNSESSSQATVRGDNNRFLNCHNQLSPSICGQDFVTLHKRLISNSTTTSDAALKPNTSKQTIISKTPSSSSPTSSLSTVVPRTSQTPTTSTTLSTSSQISTPSASTTPFTTIPPTPTTTETPSRLTKVYKFPIVPLWVGISLALLFLALIIYLLLRLEFTLYQRRQRTKLMSTIPRNPHQGLRTLHLPHIIHNKKGKANRRSRIDYDGRRVAVTELDVEENGNDIQSMEAGRRNREAFEKWKRNRGFGAGWSEEVDAVKRVETVQESSQDKGSKRERRKTYEAWKKGVVPPPKECEKRDSIGRDEDFELGRMPDSGV